MPTPPKRRERTEKFANIHKIPIRNPLGRIKILGNRMKIFFRRNGNRIDFFSTFAVWILMPVNCLSNIDNQQPAFFPKTQQPSDSGNLLPNG